MRKFINISKLGNAELTSKFPCLGKLIEGEENITEYEQHSVSVFDHWLSSKECVQLIDNLTPKEITVNDEKLHKFAVDLTKQTEAYLVKCRGRKKGEITFRKFTSNESLITHLKPKNHLASNSNRFILALPELKSIYFENWDFTHHIFTVKNTDLSLLKSIASVNGLHILQ